jgi:hypothetical protein
MAGSEAAKEAIYLSTFLRELGLDMSKPPPLKLDNKSAIDLAYNPEHHSKTKHIESVVTTSYANASRTANFACLSCPPKTTSPTSLLSH